MSELYIERDGEFKSITDIEGVSVLAFEKSSPNQVSYSTEGERFYGKIPNGHKFGTKAISVRLLLKARDYQDYHMAEEEINDMIFQDEEYYIFSSLYPGVKYLVEPQPFKPSRESNIVGIFEFDYEVVKGFGESRGSTLDPLTFDTELWQTGQGILLGEDMQYKHKTSTFKIYNAGSLGIDPEKRHDLIITLTCEGSPRIWNKTTGTAFQCNKYLKKSDKLVLKGIHCYINNNLSSRDGNHVVIKLKPGWNEFEISRCTNIDISFDFPFLYK